MPSTRIAIKATDNHKRSFGVIQAERGFLESARISQTNTLQPSNTAFAIIQLVSSETPIPSPIATLASGYIGGALEIGWTGKISLEPTFGIRATIQALENQIFNLSIHTEV